LPLLSSLSGAGKRSFRLLLGAAWPCQGRLGARLGARLRTLLAQFGFGDLQARLFKGNVALAASLGHNQGQAAAIFTVDQLAVLGGPHLVLDLRTERRAALALPSQVPARARLLASSESALANLAKGSPLRTRTARASARFPVSAILSGQRHWDGDQQETQLALLGCLS